MTFAFDIPRAIEIITQAMLRELGDEIDLIFRYGSLIRGNTNKYSALGFPQLLPYVEAKDYTGLAEQTRLFDQRLQEYLTENNIPLNSFASLEELQIYLDNRST